MRSELHESGVRRQGGRRFRSVCGDRLTGMRGQGETARRRTRLAAATALAVSGVGGTLVVMFAGHPSTTTPALTPIQTAPSPAPEPDSVPRGAGSELFESFGSDDGADTLRRPAAPPAVPASMPTAPVLPALPAPPAFQLPAPPQLPPAIDWQALVQPYLQSQANAAAANIAGSIAGSTGSGAADAAAAALGDLILYAAYSDKGLLSQLQNALPPVAVAGPPDFSGLSAAFAAAAGQPPYGVPALPQPPELPPLPDLSELSALQRLPRPGEMPALPNPEQVAAALAAVPVLALALPAVPALPPIGMPEIGLPGLGPPPVGLPPIGMPSIGFPSITRLFGLPF